MKPAGWHWRAVAGGVDEIDQQTGETAAHVCVRASGLDAVGSAAGSPRRDLQTQRSRLNMCKLMMTRRGVIGVRRTQRSRRRSRDANRERRSLDSS